MLYYSSTTQIDASSKNYYILGVKDGTPVYVDASDYIIRSDIVHDGTTATEDSYIALRAVEDYLTTSRLRGPQGVQGAIWGEVSSLRGERGYQGYKGDSTARRNISGRSDGTGYNVHEGNLYATAFYVTSDKSKKENVESLPSVLDRVLSIKTFIYNFKGESIREVGVSAQQIAELFPELVQETNGFLTVDYAGLSVVVLKAYQEFLGEYQRI